MADPSKQRERHQRDLRARALAKEGLLAEDAPKLPAAASDRGTQMTSKSTQQFFFDLGNRLPSEH